MSAGFRLDQGPPFLVPLLFFLAACVFLALAGLYAAWNWQDWPLSRWNLSAVVLTHLLALGYLGFVMLGALTQVAPVAAGARLPGVRLAAWLSHGLLLVGLPLYAWGLHSGHGPGLLAGASAAAGGLAVMTLVGLAGLARGAANPTRQGMLLALSALAATLVLGLVLAGWMGGYWAVPGAAALVDSHAALGLVGWVGLLVLASSYQVVPMLQLTPHYPPWARRWLAPALALVLAAWVGLNLSGAVGWARLLAAVAIALLASYAGLTLDLQRRRRRKRRDVTLDYWRLGLSSLALAVLLAGLVPWLPDPWQTSLELVAGLLFLLGFAAAVVNGMVMKIVPFLAWFHLQAQGACQADGLAGMAGFYPDGAARRQYRLHLAALACLLPSPWWPWLAVPGGLLLAGAGGMLLADILAAVRLFRRHGGCLEAA